MLEKLESIRTYIASELKAGDVVRPLGERQHFSRALVLSKSAAGITQITPLDGEYAFTYWPYDDELGFIKMASWDELLLKIDDNENGSENAREFGTITIDRTGLLICLAHKPRGFTEPTMFSLTTMEFVNPRFEFNRYLCYPIWSLGVMSHEQKLMPLFDKTLPP